jgi:hypothetical protein
LTLRYLACQESPVSIGLTSHYSRFECRFFDILLLAHYRRSPLLAQLTRDSETRSLGSSTLKRDGALL